MIRKVNEKKFVWDVIKQWILFMGGLDIEFLEYLFFYNFDYIKEMDVDVEWVKYFKKKKCLIYCFFLFGVMVLFGIFFVMKKVDIIYYC